MPYLTKRTLSEQIPYPIKNRPENSNKTPRKKNGKSIETRPEKIAQANPPSSKTFLALEKGINP